jgi:rhamnosyltransferase
MGSLGETTAAVMVVRRGSPRLHQDVQALSAAVATVIVVDNHDLPDDSTSSLAVHPGVVVLHNGNRHMLAGAYNLALRWIDRQRPVTRQVLFLDEDSEAGPVSRLLADPQTGQLLADPHCAAVSAAYRERATGLRARYLWLTRWRLHWMPREFDGPRRVSFIINSMSVWSRTALDRIGGFDEGLALDHIDTDACLRARHAGYQVWVHGGHEFMHSIGARRSFKIFGREMQAGGHSAERRWLIARNTVRLARRECWREPAFAWLCVMRLGYEAVGVVLAETEKLAKLGALARGASRGLIGA